MRRVSLNMHLVNHASFSNTIFCVYSRSIDDPELFPIMHVISGMYKLKIFWLNDKEIFEIQVNEDKFTQLITLEDGYGKSIINNLPLI